MDLGTSKMVLQRDASMLTTFPQAKAAGGGAVFKGIFSESTSNKDVFPARLILPACGELWTWMEIVLLQCSHMNNVADFLQRGARSSQPTVSFASWFSAAHNIPLSVPSVQILVAVCGTIAQCVAWCWCLAWCSIFTAVGRRAGVETLVGGNERSLFSIKGSVFTAPLLSEPDAAPIHAASLVAPMCVTWAAHWGTDFIGWQLEYIVRWWSEFCIMRFEEKRFVKMVET